MSNVETTVISHNIPSWVKEILSWGNSAVKGFLSLYGLGDKWDKLSTSIVNKVNGSTLQDSTALKDEVVNTVVNEMITWAQAAGETALSKLQTRLDAFPYITSSTTKSFITNAKQKIKDQITAQQQKNAKVNVLASKASASASNAQTADSSDAITGVKQSYQQDAIKYGKQALEESGSTHQVDLSAVETNVNKGGK